ncbi:MAG: ABC transporter ATP-binding protein [Nocardioides sp.]
MAALVTTPVLEVREVTKRFGGLVAVRDVSFSLEPGEILAVIGQNGAGKSTLLSVVGGARKPTSGEVFLDGRRVTKRSTDHICRAGLSRTFQIPKPFSRMTVRENVRVAATYGGRRRGVAEHPDEILEFCQLTHCADALPAELGHGDHRRIEFARSLATNPRVMLLDELGAGLSDVELRAFAELVRRVAERGIGIVFVEHVMSLVMALAQRIVVMETGRVIADGTPEEVATDEEVLRSYLGLPGDVA